jgi:hypothetical protein
MSAANVGGGDVPRRDELRTTHEARAVDSEASESNLRRLRVFLPTLLLLHAMGLWAWRSSPADATEAVRRWLANLFALHVVGAVFAVASMLLVLLRPKSLSIVTVRMGELVAAFYLLWTALVSVNAQPTRPNIELYTLACFALAALIVTRSAPMIVAQLTASAIVLGGIVRFHPSPMTLRASVTNTIAVTLVSVVLSRVLSANFLRAARDRRTIERQKAELEELNRELEARVERKAGELLAKAAQVHSLAAQLQQKVRDRSEELSRALSRLHRAKGGGVELGMVLGDRVKLVGHIGEGGMGSVFLGHDLVSGERVAVKVLLAGDAQDVETLHRFFRESRAAASIEHPAVARTSYVDVSSEGVLFQVQELVQGVSLSALLKEQLVVSDGEAARFGAVLADALRVAHEAGVVHRDIKPSNVMVIASDPGLKLLDFGVAKVRSSAAAPSVTRTGEIVGTPEYMAPEQILTPDAIDDRTDVYGLGLLLYRMREGRGPFDVKSVGEYFTAHAIETPKAMTEAVDARLTAIVQRCLAKEPRLRPSAFELSMVLSSIADVLQAPSLPAITSRWVRSHEGRLHVARPSLAPTLG